MLNNVQMRLNIVSSGKVVTTGITGFTDDKSKDYLHFNMPKGDIYNRLIEVEVKQGETTAKVALSPKMIKDLCKAAADFADRVENGKE